MQIITSIIGFVFSDWITFLTCLAVGWSTYKLSKFYVKVWSLPKGPTPLPVVGNILSLRGRKPNNVLTFTEMSKKYGPVYTFWVSGMPMVIVSDFELSKEAYKKSEFAGRLMLPAFKLIRGPKDDKCNIAFDDFGPRWESNRRVAHAAVRKYAVSDKLPTLIANVMDEQVNDMFRKEGDRPFDFEPYSKELFAILLVSIAFGKRFKPNDFELSHFLNFLNLVNDPLFTLLQFLPYLRIFYPNMNKRLHTEFVASGKFLRSQFEEHMKDFDENHIRDFCDALLLAKKEAIEEAKETAPYLTNDNLGLAILDLFIAGSSTSQTATQWIILYMANYPEYQTKMRQEIASIIGNRTPVQEDRNECHLINAFLHEVLRCRPIAPFGVPRKAMVDAKIGDHIIPKDTIITQNIWSFHHNPKYFTDPYQFKPERFLDFSGRFLTQKPAAFIPFGSGRRVCPGEKLAIADIFLVIANLLQKTSGYEIALKNGAGSGDLEMDPNQELNCQPKKFEIVLKKNS